MYCNLYPHMAPSHLGQQSILEAPLQRNKFSGY